MIDYSPIGATGFRVAFENSVGHWIEPICDPEPALRGSAALLDNLAFTAALTLFGENEFAFRRARSKEKQKVHGKASKRHSAEALAIGELVAHGGDDRVSGWCSGCFERTEHRRVRGHARPRSKYLCQKCGTPTTRCAVPRCQHFAVMPPDAWHTLCYCAEHRHAIPGFEKLDARIVSLETWKDWAAFESVNAARATKVAGGTLATAAVIAPAAFFAAPVVGAALGGSALGGSLTGAAATSHGLAMLGGGSIASGGLGMAGGTAVVTATGSALGGALGASTVMAYAGADKSFDVVKLRDGVGPAVVLASGFLTEGDSGWGPWQELIDKRFAESPVYRVHWGAHELKKIAILMGGASAKVGVRMVLTNMAKKGSKAFGRLSYIGAVLLARDVTVNPWSVAKNRAGMTGAALADILARTEEGSFILVGHSLGARVMVTCAQTLGSRGGVPRIDSMHLLGAAVGRKGDWSTLDDAVSGSVFNYWSPNDEVLRRLYVAAEFGQRAAGQAGFGSTFAKIKDRNVGRLVRSHSGYFHGVKLARD